MAIALRPQICDVTSPYVYLMRDLTGNRERDVGEKEQQLSEDLVEQSVQCVFVSLKLIDDGRRSFDQNEFV